MLYKTLKNSFKYFILIAITTSSLAQEGAVEAQQVAHAGTWLSVVPPLLAIVIALAFKQVIPALFTGLVFGVWVIGGMSFSALFTAPLTTLEVFAVKALADEDHASIILFSFMIGGMVGITSRNGGMQGIVNLILRWANSVKRASLATVGMGLSIFFDDYANTLVVGNTMRPVTDKMKISREKLAYLVDSTAAPIACLALVTTWVGFQVGLIDDALKAVGYDEMGGYGVFLQTIPYSFYPIFALFLTIMVASTGKDFGPMHQAEVEARNANITSLNLDKHPTEEILPVEDKPHRALNAILPFLTLILVVLGGLYYTGLDNNVADQTIRDIVGNANSYKALLWGTMSGVLMAAVLSVIQGILTLEQTVNALLKGMKPMLLAMIILVLAWSLSEISAELQTSQYISGMIQDALSVHWLPLLIFLLAALTAFATGSSWGAMGILIPLVVPIVWNMMGAQGVLETEYYYIIYTTIASILAGAVWGDHCSPISDTTILSSMASGCDHIEHVRTQIPYAFYAGGFAMIIGIIPASFGFSPWLLIVIATIGMYLGLRWKGKEA
ncbi:Na+/H+ antiporter NhaC family protein [Marinicella sp. S1101]|uniref:Na+/H+ antiporter NhaC family protein n=1 Tax=Marinicella marina TaxID=2996016 RepID=UPI0024BC3D37|nr:Na+/H+ antiporter NhaC family protein [Marinicella marina]MCX7553516.1 Na+/H+ antiporter NhaC family protein [Marinicella marina]MDJ1140140.1 Na+/H+ antiporter NhaC family protein [Marinicella marina]